MNSGIANVGDGERGLAVAREMVAATAGALDLEADRVGVASTGVIGVGLEREPVVEGIGRAVAELSPDGGARFRRSDHDHRSLGQARRPGRVPGQRVRAAVCAGKGRRDDLAFLRHDALLRPDRRGDRRRHARPAAESRGRAVVRAHVGRRPALHERLRVLLRERRRGLGRRARHRGRAGLRHGARRAAAPACAGDRRRRRGGRACRAPRSAGLDRGGRPGRARRGKLTAREMRAARGRPQLGTHPRRGGPGGAGRGRRRARPVHRGRAGRERRHRGRARRRRPPARGRGHVRARGRPAAGPVRRAGRRPRSSSATWVTGTCPSTRSTRREQRPPGGRTQRRPHRDAAGVAPLHPGVLRRDDRDQVRRCGDGRGGPARGLRARRGAAQVRRHEPGGRARRWPGDHRLHAAARARGRVRAGPARVGRADGRDREDGADRQGEQGHRAAPQPPRSGGGRVVRRRRLHVPGREAPRHGTGRRARSTSGSSAPSSAWTSMS